jgi:hypothetical protein
MSSLKRELAVPSFGRIFGRGRDVQLEGELGATALTSAHLNRCFVEPRDNPFEE